MRPSIFIRSHSAFVSPKKIDLENEVASKRLDRELFEKHQYISLSAFPENTVPSQILENISRDALKKAELEGNQLSFVLFSASLFKEKSTWSQSAELARRLTCPQAVFLDVYQGCNGFLSTLELAIMYFQNNPEFQHGLIASLDFFPEALGKRWNFDYDTFYGDGAGVWILSRSAGEYSIKAIKTAQHADLNPFISSVYGSFADIQSGFQSKSFSVKPSKKAFLENKTKDYVQATFDMLNIDCVKSCLKQARLTAQEIDHLLIPNFSKYLIEKMSNITEIELVKTSWEVGRRVGHMGSADPAVNLFLMENDGEFKPGQHLLLLFHGAGVSATCCILKKE